MQSMEFCLDAILLKLVRDWNNYGDERLELNAEDLLTSFDLPPQYRKHEFFVRLIDRLIRDGYAEIINSRPAESKIDIYQRNIIVTIEGYFLITQEGGYTQKKINRDAENTRLASLEYHQKYHRRWMTALTTILAVGGLIAAVFYLAELYWKYGWFHCPCHQ